jgi:hypothetical protein
LEKVPPSKVPLKRSAVIVLKRKRTLAEVFLTLTLSLGE